MPEFMPWNNKYSVNSITIDTQHKRLFELVNELHEAMLQGKGKDVVGGILQATMEYARSHFSDEERMLEKSNYPNLARQRSEHESFINKVKELQSAYAAGQPVLSRAALDFLKEWIGNHILVEDQRYAPYLKI
jgi:hemerythrin-like metal-binding protein